MSTPSVLSLETEEALARWVEPYLRNAEERAYFQVHVQRYLRAVEVVKALLKDRAGSPITILDIAPHLLSEVFASSMEATVNTVGVRFLPSEASHARLGEHMDLDLNALHEREAWRSFHRHDLVFMGEILEHLHAAPSMVLGCTERWVKPGGYLVIQTPNAVSLARRLSMAAGKHPYEMLNPGRNPGHIREYTAPELLSIAQALGLRHIRTHYENYFRQPSRTGLRAKLFHAFTRVPKTLREGMTLVFQKPHEGKVEPLPSRRLHGHLEFMGQHSDGQFHAVGWIFDHERNIPIEKVELRLGDHVLQAVVPSMPRQDVATSLKQASITNCGFHFTVAPSKAPPGSSVSVYATDRFGDFLRLELAD
jgi:hypothetical protein